MQRFRWITAGSREAGPRPGGRHRVLRSGDESHAPPARQEQPQRPELQAVAGHVRDFADLMNKHRGDRLPDWMLRVQATTCLPCTPRSPAYAGTWTRSPRA
jgi:hypothetical protein